MLDIEDVRELLKIHEGPTFYNIPTVEKFAFEELLEYKETGLMPDETKYARDFMLLELERMRTKMFEVKIKTETIKYVIDACRSGRTLNQYGVVIYNCLKELLEYRETELTPDKIREMDKLYLEKCQEVNSLVEACEKLEGRK